MQYYTLQLFFALAIIRRHKFYNMASFVTNLDDFIKSLSTVLILIDA